MTKKVLIIDNLTETFSGSVVRSGLQKSSKLDARAFSSLGYDTTFLYCGELEDHYPYKKVCVNNIGAKENLIKDGKHMCMTANYVKAYLERAISEITNADYIISHCHSLSNITCPNLIAKDKKIIYVIHDVIDMFRSTTFSKVVTKMRKTARNYSKVVTNSQYSIDRLNYIRLRTKDNLTLLSGDEAFDDYIKHFVWTDLNPTYDDIIYKEKKSAVIGRYEAKKFHHAVYKYKNPNNLIVHYGIKDERRDIGLKYYKTLKLKANSYAEGLSDDELWNAIKSSQSIILPCPHEGFGFTAFEAGIFGVVPIIFTSYNGTRKADDPQVLHSHATCQYLERANVKHFRAKLTDHEGINRTIDDSLLVTAEDRLKISKNLLSYFTLENYVQERVNLLENTTKKNNETTIERFLG